MKKFLVLVFILSLMTFVMCGCDLWDHDDENHDSLPNQEELLSVDEVKEIIFDRLPGTTEDDIFEMDKEVDDGRVVYEGSVYYDGLEYEFEIDGETGNILEWDIDD